MTFTVTALHREAINDVTHDSHCQGNVSPSSPVDEDPRTGHLRDAHADHCIVRHMSSGDFLFAQVPHNRGAVVTALEAEFPWIRWLDGADRQAFADALDQIASSCRESGQYGPLGQLLNRWKASAEIMHSPELKALLTAPRGKDTRVVLSRPDI